MLKKDKVIAIVLLISSLFILPAEVSSQSNDQNNEEYSRWSMSVYGGYTYPEKGQGLQIFASRFNVISNSSYNFGAGIEYSLTPYWSIEGGYRYSPVEGIGFETKMHTASLRNKIHLNRAISRRAAAQIINPYLILGIEHDFFSVEAPDDEFSRSESSLIGGLGLAFRLSNRIELFGQHEIKVSSNRIDNTDRGFPYDQIGMTSGGIRIHFNKNGQKPLNLATPARRITDQDFSTFVTKAGELETTRLQLSERESRIDELERLIAESEREKEALAAKILMSEEHADSLNSALDNCVCGVEPEAQLLRNTVNAGHYIQVYATTEYSAAQLIKDQFISLMGPYLDNPEEMVFIISRKQFFEVLIGSFNQFGDTQRVLAISKVEHSDSFVITFPRPMHLEEQYQGTAIIHEELAPETAPEHHYEITWRTN